MLGNVRVGRHHLGRLFEKRVGVGPTLLLERSLALGERGCGLLNPCRVELVPPDRVHDRHEHARPRSARHPSATIECFFFCGGGATTTNWGGAARALVGLVGRPHCGHAGAALAELLTAIRAGDEGHGSLLPLTCDTNRGCSVARALNAPHSTRHLLCAMPHMRPGEHRGHGAHTTRVRRRQDRPLPEVIGARIRSLRNARAISRKGLAEKSGVALTSLVLLERGGASIGSPRCSASRACSKFESRTCSTTSLRHLDRTPGRRCSTGS